MIPTYDIIIGGGGMSGLSLAYYLTQNTKTQNLKILIIDPQEKKSNDRTWGFWQEGESPFDAILTGAWREVLFTTTTNKTFPLDLENYEYKLLRGADFYSYIHKQLEPYANVEFLRERIIEIDDKGSTVLVRTETKELHAKWLFDSTFKLDLTNPNNQNMLQHFKGAVIETKEEVFNVDLPDLMNFSVSQKNGECRFIYVLPFSRKKALVEYTLFTESLLSDKEYDEELFNFISSKITGDYDVLEEEFGVIPMSDVPTEEFPSARVIRIGTAGGSTNPSTGYTFANTQKRLKELVDQLANTGSPYMKQTWWERRHHLYAAILLNVLIKKRYSAALVFEELYRKNRPALVFKFLDGSTSFFEELSIMWSTRIYHFGSAALQVIKKRFLAK